MDESQTYNVEDLPDGAVVKNLPANAGDMGSIPGPQEDSKPVPHSYWSLHALEPVLHNQRSHYHEKPSHGNERAALTCCNERNPSCSNEDRVQSKIYQ